MSRLLIILSQQCKDSCTKDIVVYYDYDCIVSRISYYVIIMSSVSVCDFDLLRMHCFSCASCLVLLCEILCGQ